MVVFHIDMDAFFASVEQRDHPEWIGKPVIVGAQPGTRGVVSAASYEARKFGVHSAMPVSEAYRRCPAGIFAPPRMSVYSEVSRQIMKILYSFSPVIEQISVDEAFMDMSGTEKLYGTDYGATAKRVCTTIKEQTRLTASAGVAPNKFLAKIASDLNKPDGVSCAPFDRDGIMRWLAPMNVGKIWGVGKKTQLELSRYGITTVEDLQGLSLEYLSTRFNKSGGSLYYLCRGIDSRTVGGGEPVKSISREQTFNRDSSSRDEWKETIFVLAQDVARSARKNGVKGATVVLTWRRPDFSRHSRRKTLANPTDLAREIFEVACTLLDQLQEKSIRLLGVGITGLDKEQQLDLFSTELNREHLERSERTVDKLLQKFGPGAVVKGTELGLRKRSR